MKHILLLTFLQVIGITTAFSQTDTVILSERGKYAGAYPEGRGVLCLEADGIYIGQFKNGIPDGICTHYLKNGNKYHGEFRDGKYSGYGRYDRKNGTICVGDFKNNSPDGVDTVYYKSGAIYVGKYKNGVRHGHGIQYSQAFHFIYYLDGEYINGNLADGFRTHKSGLYTVISGKTIGEPSPPIITQTDLRHTYSILKGALPKFPGEPLNEEQKEFLKKKK